MDLIEVLKAKTHGMPDEVVITLTTQQGRTLLDQLEAERQQRAQSDARIRELEFQWEHRAPTQWAYDQTCAALHSQRERAEAAEKERDGLTGKIESERQRSEELEQICKNEYQNRKRLEAEIAELRAELATPVVLSARFSPFHSPFYNSLGMERDKDGEYLNRDDVIEAIRAAGFTVKGGE